MFQLKLLCLSNLSLLAFIQIHLYVSVEGQNEILFSNTNLFKYIYMFQLKFIIVALFFLVAGIQIHLYVSVKVSLSCISLKYLFHSNTSICFS